MCADDRRGWSGRTECHRPIASHLGRADLVEADLKGVATATATTVANDRRGQDAGLTTAGTALRRQGRASRIMLNGVSVARRILVKPPAVMTSRSLASPACAPSAEPTSCDSEVGTQIIVEAA